MFPGCDAQWQREFLDSNFSASFRVKEYKAHRENILCEREKSRLPETQALCDTVQARRQFIDEDILSIEEENNALRDEIRALSAKYAQKIDRNARKVHRHHINRQLLHDVLAGRRDSIQGDSTFADETLRRATKFTVQCPLNSCKGLLNERFVCSVCNERVCRRCHVPRGKYKAQVQIKQDAIDKGKGKGKGKEPAKEEGDEVEDEEDDDQATGGQHVCDPDTLATIKHLRMSSKGCPGCGARISKIDGCDQMWCIGCHTAFSWKTGEKVSARAQVHNPHFYEWKRNNGGLAAGAVDANGCPVAHNFQEAAVARVKLITRVNTVKWILFDIAQEIVHLQQVEMQPTYEENLTDPMRPMRIQYMKGALSERDWKINLQRFEKKRCKRVELQQVYQMYTASMIDIYRKIAEAINLSELETYNNEMRAMCHLTSTCFRNISQRYGQVCSSRVYAGWEQGLAQYPHFV